MFFVFLIFPEQTLDGAVSGLMLWFHILLPTLLPFIIITTLIIKTQAFYLISNFVSPMIQRFFHTSSAGSFAVIVGFLCGYPMGAKVIRDLYTSCAINKNEAQYLLSFCNNTSPMFIISFVINQTLQYSYYTIPVLGSVYFASIITSFITRRIYVKDIDYNANVKEKQNRLSLTIIDDSIMEGIQLITKIGGYIMLFSILICLGISLTEAFTPIIHMLLLLLEVTNGVTLSMELPGFALQYLTIIFLISFGGICSIAQTQCVLEGSDLRITPYIMQKIITAILAVIISSVFIFLL